MRPIGEPNFPRKISSGYRLRRRFKFRYEWMDWSHTYTNTYMLNVTVEFSLELLQQQRDQNAC